MTRGETGGPTMEIDLRVTQEEPQEESQEESQENAGSRGETGRRVTLKLTGKV